MLDSDRILDLNEFIHKDSKLFDYHINHIHLTRRYALLLADRLGSNIDPNKLEYIALAHDLFKERALNKKKIFVEWEGLQVPQDINQYVRLNLDILEGLLLDEYFNTDIQLHPQAAAIFLIKEFGINDPEIIYPIIFHSCPIIPVYETLSQQTREAVDIIVLADKLSSNWLKINTRTVKVRTDLDLMVFGLNGREFNYTLGLLVARLISQGNSKEKNSVISTNHYHKRLKDQNPLTMQNISLRKLGGNAIWPKRKSQHWMTP